MKGVQLIVSKKMKEEVSNKKQANKKKKQQPKNQAIDRFNHTFFLEQMFDKVNVLPPASEEELDKTIKDLE